MDAEALAEAAEDDAASHNEEKKYEEDLRRERERQKYEAAVFSASAPLLLELFEEYPDVGAGKELSRLERQVNNYSSSTLTYSEVDFASFHRIFTRLNRLGLSDENQGKFVDVGSGVGKVVFSAALFHDFSKVVGIEILSGLHAASVGVLESWRELRRQLPQRKRDMDISLLLGDALSMPWSNDTDVVFINATCFTRDMLRPLGREACRMRPGALLAITTHKLDAAVDPALPQYLELALADSMDASFGGSVAVHFYRRTKRAPLGEIADMGAYVDALLEPSAP